MISLFSLRIGVRRERVFIRGEFETRPQMKEFGIRARTKVSALCALGLGYLAYCRFSNIAAAPIPVPMHMETTPYFDLRLFIS